MLFVKIHSALRRHLTLVVASLVLAFPGQLHAAEPCNKRFEDIYKDAVRSIVLVNSLRIDPFAVNGRIRMSYGAGVTIEDGYVVTNAHLVWQADSVTVTIEGSTQNATVVGADPITDLAVLKTEEGLSGVPPIDWGDSDKLAVGQDVLAIGHPLKLRSSASRGIVSGMNRIIPTTTLSWIVPLIQTDAALLPGSSGGPLMDRCGKVLGINSVMVAGQHGVGFAVPSNLARAVASELIKNKKVSRPWHGLRGTIIDAALREVLQAAYGVDVTHGFLVETVEPGSPAAEAGIKGGRRVIIMRGKELLIGGDIITKVNGVKIDGLKAAIKAAKSLRIGQSITVHLAAANSARSVTFTIKERPYLPGDARRFSP